MYETVIKGAMICDGLGGPMYQGSLGITDGRIAAIGSDIGPGRETVDAEGLILSPGFIDIHTHYDAQITWDSYATPSTSLGVTTIVIGNCGFGIAPCKPEDRDTVAGILTHVEGMPLEAFKAGLNWDFESFPEYLDMLEGRGVVANLAAFIPHSPLRCFVMGKDAFNRAATKSELNQMKKIVSQALKAGALGFSSSTTEFHNGEGGVPVPSRLADTDEFHEIMKTMGEVGHGVFMVTRGSMMTIADLEEMSKISGRPVVDAALFIDEGNPTRVSNAFKDIESAQKKGISLYGQVGCLPLTMDFSLENPYPFEAFLNWRPAMETTTKDGFKEVLQDPAFRAKIREEATQIGTPGRFSGQWEEVDVVEVARESNTQYEGKTIAEIAIELSRDPLDVFLDLGISEDLKTQFSMRMLNTNEEKVKDVLDHPYSVIGQSDAGAHVSLLCDAAFGPYLLGRWVRERQDFMLEHAIKLVTSRQAQIYGIKDRGVLQQGAYADLLLFDSQTIARGSKRKVHDLPENCMRIDTPALGIYGTWVNGVRIADRNGVFFQNDKKPGKVLRKFNS